MEDRSVQSVHGTLNFFVQVEVYIFEEEEHDLA